MALLSMDSVHEFINNLDQHLEDFYDPNDDLRVRLVDNTKSLYDWSMLSFLYFSHKISEIYSTREY